MAALLHKPPEPVYQAMEYRLSRNAQSSLLHTPLQLDRITTNPQTYKAFLQECADDYDKRPTWGVSRAEAKIGSNQPTLAHLDKNHLHFGSTGFSYPRALTRNPQYDLTQLKKSNARATDELIPSSNKVDVRIARIIAPSTGDPPYSSHTSRLAVFPKLDVPADATAACHRQAWAPQDNTASIAGGQNVVVTGKARGTPYRREVIQITEDSENKAKSPLYEAHSLGQVASGTQSSHAFPTTFGSRTFPDQSAYLTVSQTTANTLQKLRKQYNTTEYDHRYSQNGDQDLRSICTGRDEQRKDFENDVARNDAQFRGKVRAIESERPYTTTYKADFFNEALPGKYTRQVSMKQLGRSTGSLKTNPSSPSNKSVKFRDQVTISDGHQTSSALVNDFNNNAQQQAGQLLKMYSGAALRPSTAPLFNEFSHNGASDFPSAPVLSHATYPVSSPEASLQRPHTTGRISLASQLGRLQNSFSKSDVHRKFHKEFPESVPDIRRKPDMRITTNERRHVIPEVGCHSYYFHG